MQRPPSPSPLMPTVVWPQVKPQILKASLVSNNSTEPHEPLKILFMHGLESRPGGSKDRYLRRYFKKVCTPDMKMSACRLTRSNSVVRNLLRRPLLWGWAAAAVAALPLGWAIYGPLAFPVWAVVFGGVLMAIRGPLTRQALAASLDRCLAIQTAAIREFRPDLVVGSSWGAAVALMCASRGIYSGPMLLLAPPVKMVLDRLGDADGSHWETLCGSISPEVVRRILVVHGDQDATVPVEDSRSLAAATGLELRVVAGDHRLNAALMDGEDGPDTSERLKQLITEVAARR